MQTPQPQKRTIDWARYILALFITVTIFASIFYISNLINNRRVVELRSIQDKLSIDLLSSETQFSLLSQTSCKQKTATSVLSPEIGQLGDRLSFMEQQLDADNAELIGLKKYYTLLQIKDYMLVSALAEKCHNKPVTILYFYAKDCDDCTKQGYVLTALREKYPALRVYSFDSDLDLSVLRTLETINVVGKDRPTIVIDSVTYPGFKSVEDIEKILAPQLDRLSVPADSERDQKAK